MSNFLFLSHYGLCDHDRVIAGYPIGVLLLGGKEFPFFSCVSSMNRRGVGQEKINYNFRSGFQ